MKRNFSLSTTVLSPTATLLLFALLLQPTWAEVKHVKATRETLDPFRWVYSFPAC